MGWTTDEDGLSEAFEPFGELKYVLLVRDKVTGESKGTAFLQFKRKEDAEKALQEAYKSALYKNAKTTQDKESDIVVDGRRLIIDLAVDRNSANTITSSNEKERDKRNLKLADYGSKYSHNDHHIHPSRPERRSPQEASRS